MVPIKIGWKHLKCGTWKSNLAFGLEGGNYSKLQRDVIVEKDLKCNLFNVKSAGQ